MNLEYRHRLLIGRSSKNSIGIQLTNFIHSALNDKKYAIGVFSDLKKAFDVCSHTILLGILKKLGIRDKVLEWFSSYLKHRLQKVDINGSLSTAKSLDISVLQGSILGPILFLCYINDLHLCTTLYTTMFADDLRGLTPTFAWMTL